jgi:hypothetical protein
MNEIFMMKTLPLRLIFIALALSPSLWLSAQSASHTYKYKIAQERLLWHDNIFRQQKRLFKPGTDSVSVSDDPLINKEVDKAMIEQIDKLQQQVEQDTSISNQAKIKWLRSIETLVSGFADNYSKRDFSPAIAPNLVKAYASAMQLDRDSKSIESVVDSNVYGVGKILLECFLYPSENAGVRPSRDLLVKKYCVLHPDEILGILRNNPYYSFADSLIIVAGHRDIEQLYRYAQGNTTLSARMRSSKDRLVHTVAALATSRSGQLYYPFLDNLIKGRITTEEIDRVKDDGLNYYRLLVRTRLDYAERLLQKDTALEMGALTNMLRKKAVEIFINEINALHDKPDPVRFKILEPLTAEELYYLVVLSEAEIYTSSYVHGVYPAIFQRMKIPRGDSLIMLVHGDYFRKFIKMAAAYNTIDHFLGTMDKENAGVIMKAFIIGLEKAGEEDAVDVADSYSSIFDKNPTLAKFVLNAVKWNYNKNLKNNNKKGIIIYNLLQTLFESADTNNKVDLSAKLGIPPVYSVDYNSLRDSAGRVIQEAFFYGNDEDKDGQTSFADFMALFRGKPAWKITENPKWVSISSTKGKPVLIFANRPLNGENDPDEKAQDDLGAYLEEHHMKPSIFIHRGHSYHVSSTLKRIQPTARIVILGSCGGYNNLSEVLKISSDAHIISSKQTGTKTVNEPILQEINNTLNAGQNINWISMWKGLNYRFRNDAVARDRFDDYIPPYKNLGLIFIKAYRKAMEN